MSAVTNQSLYEEIKVILPTKEVCPRLIKLAQKVILVASLCFLTVATGMALSLFSGGISLTTGAVGGLIVGLVVGNAVALGSKFPSNVERYRLEVLDKLKSITSNPRGLSAIRTLENFFYYPFTGFKEPFHHHLLHGELAALGDTIDPSRPDARKVWSDFLTHLHGTTLFNSDNEKVVFNGSFLARRFSGYQKQVTRQWLGSWFSPSREELEAIAKIGKESFGREHAFTSEKIAEKLRAFRPNGLRVATDQETGQILGYGWYYTEKGVVHIAEIARLPEAARLGIGTALLYDILQAQKKGQPIQISLHQSNPFRGKLERYGFTPITGVAAVNEILMQLDWEKYGQLLSRLEAT